MPTFNGRQFTGFPGINLGERNGVLRFEVPINTPITTSGERMLYINSSNELIYNNGSSTTIIGAAGGGGTPTFETLFAADNTFTVTPDITFTIAGNRSTATNVLTLTNIAGGSGAILAFTNDTATNNDVLGTASTWAVTGEGNSTFKNLTLTGTTITSTTGDETWTLRDNRSAALSFGSSGDTNILVIDTSNAAPMVVLNDGLSMTDGNATFISTSNTATNVLVTNNTITTFGANANSAGVVCIRSTSLTTGSLLQLQVSDTALAGGFYLCCRESVGGTNDFTIGENGAITIGGVAGSDVFTVTAGDVVLSDASLAITDADNAASLTVTNDTATTASVVVLAGSGAFTGTTTSSFATLTASGLTSGTVLYIPAAALTTGKIVDIVSTSATDAAFLTLTGNTANQTTTGKMINVDLVANVAAQGLKIATTGVYTGTAGLVDLDVGAMTTGVMLALTSTTGLTSGSLIRATTSTAGAIATNGAYSFVGTGDFTVGAVGLGMFHVANNTTVAGTVASISGTALTTGVALHIASTGTGMTSGSLLRMTTGTTGAVATNGVMALTATGAYTSASRVGALATFTADSTLTGTILSVSGTALTTGVALDILSSGTGMTSGSLLRLSTGTTGAVATNGVVSVRATGAYTSTSNAGLLDVEASATTAGTVVRIAASAALQTTSELLHVEASGYTTGYTGNVVSVTGVSTTGASNLVLLTGANTTDGAMLRLSNNALTTGVGLIFAHTTSVLASGGSLARFSSTSVDTSTTTGCLLDLSSTASTAGTQVLATLSGLTTGLGVSVVANALTTGSGLLVSSSGTITSAGEGLVNIVASGMTTGSALKIDLTEGTLTTGKYINCFDDTGTTSVFSVGENGAVLSSDFTEVVTATNVILPAESGSVFFLNSATEFVSTLPAVQAGLHFTFIVTAAPSGASYTVVTDSSSNVMLGTVHSSDGADGDSELSGCDTVNFVDGAAVVGDRLEVWCDGTNWFGIAHCNVSTGITFTTAT